MIKIKLLVTALIGSFLSVAARDCDGKGVFFEFKGGAFIPTGCEFKNIYGSTTFFISPEFAWQVHERHNWYIFLSAGYAQKDGNCFGLCSSTVVRIVPLAIGLKYFFQNMRHDDICKNSRFYVGLGFQPALLKTYGCLSNVELCGSNWGMGGVAKFGWMHTFKRNFFIDIFADYSFVNVNCCSNKSFWGCGSSSLNCLSAGCCQTNGSSFVAPAKTNISGVILGIGFGYSF